MLSYSFMLSFAVTQINFKLSVAERKLQGAGFLVTWCYELKIKVYASSCGSMVQCLPFQLCHTGPSGAVSVTTVAAPVFI